MQENLLSKNLKNGFMYKELDEHKWGGSGIEKTLFEFILNLVPKKSTIIEIGAGYCSTKALSLYYNLFSIENNLQYINLFENVNYIHAPLINDWYDTNIVKSKMPENYSLVFVDGPTGEGNRHGILNNLEIFKKDCMYIFHDTYRTPELKLAIDVSLKLNKSIFIYNADTHGDYWALVK
jgi:hypothetical protein